MLDAVMVLIFCGQVKVGTSRFAVPTFDSFNAIDWQSCQLKMISEQIRKASLRAHKVVFLTEYPELVFKNLVKVVSLSYSG